MKAGSMQRLLNHVRQAARRPGLTDGTDGQLLEAFLTERDEAAFEALVYRHGPMVLGVCRRILHDAHDAEDAFQATFLVLVRRARAVVPRERVGNWLYGVACRTALAARRAAARRRAYEKRAAPKSVVVAEEWDSDWRPAFDQELRRLPEKYRLPVVLCLLEGQSRHEVARQLGWPEGTLSSRLAAARRLLAQRLRRRGLGLPGTTGAALLAPHAVRTAVPHPLMVAAVRAAGALAAGQALPAAGLVSPSVTALVKGVLQGMWWTRLKVVTLAFLVLALIGLTAGVGAYHAWPVAQAAAPGEPVLQPPVPEPAAGPKEARKSSARLPVGPMPFPVLVSLERQGQINVTRRVANYLLERKKQPDGELRTYYAPVMQPVSMVFPLADVRVYRLQGQSIERVGAKAVGERLQAETLALALDHGQPVDPLLPALLKDGTWLFVLPAAETPTPLSPPPTTALPEVQPAQPPAPPGPGVREIPAAPVITSPVPAVPGTLSETPAGEIAALRQEIERLRRDNQQFRRMLRDGRHDLVSVMRTRSFLIPYRLAAEWGNTVELLSLFASLDRGKTWTLVAQERPRPGKDQGHFRVSAPVDGLYWFTVQTTYRNGTLDPADFTKVPPGLQVLVEGKRAEP